MSAKNRVGVLIEGTIGDSLILVPMLRMLELKFPNCLIEIVSFTNDKSISAKSVIGASFPEFSFSTIKNSEGQNSFRRLCAWLKLIKRIKSHRLNSLVYAFRPENEHASKRAKWHKLIINMLTSSKAYGFKVDSWPVSNRNDSQRNNLISKLLFERTAKALGVENSFSDFDHKIKISRHSLAAASDWLDSQFHTKTKRYYCLCTSGKTQAQHWPLPRYLKIVGELYKLHKLEPMFIGAPNEVSLHDRLIKQLGFGYSAAGLSIEESSAVLQGAEFYLGNDTGPMHLAAALGLRCVVVQSARNIVGSWDPLGEGHIVHQSTPDCAGCGAAKCLLQEQLCLTSIAADQVLLSCLTLIQSQHD